MSNHYDRGKLCCTSGLISPEPPARPYPAEINLDELVDERFRFANMLTQATLPIGHPHALAVRAWKPTCDETIVRSPRIVDKMRLHFRHRSQGLLNRKSTGLLSQTGYYDDDAQPVKSTEFMDKIESQTARDVDLDTPSPEIHDPANAGKGEKWLRSSTSQR
nr:hypothetical protein CFP56_72493 [Quercus suber]